MIKKITFARQFERNFFDAILKKITSKKIAKFVTV
jgi:hypothetical protein